MRILLVEGDLGIAEVVPLCFEVLWPEARILHAQLGEIGIEMASYESPDVIILDIGLPDIDGFEVCARIRSSSDVPIVMLTAEE